MTDKQSRDWEKYMQRTPKKKEHKPPPSPTYFEDEENQNHFEHKVYREISQLNGEINRMSLGELKNKCKSLHLDCYGKRDPLKRRLKEHFKVQMLVEAGLMEPKANPNADFFLVIDFEDCWGPAGKESLKIWLEEKIVHPSVVCAGVHTKFLQMSFISSFQGK